MAAPSARSGELGQSPARKQGQVPEGELEGAAVRLRVTGLVHGVFFRASMAEEASSEGVKGWVRNVADGSVEAYLEGDEAKIMRVVAWAKRGPPRARVDGLELQRTEPRGVKGFRIIG